MLVALAVAWLLQAFLYRAAERIFSRRSEFWRAILLSTRGPVRLAIAIFVVALALDAARLPAAHIQNIRSLLTVALIVCVAWIVRTMLRIWVKLHLRRFRIDVEDNLLARKHATQARILLRTGEMLIFFLCIGAVLMTFESVRQYGVSLLASAGAAGIVVGIALQPILRNLFAGIQLAMTQPIRLDDAVIVEGEWGNIEEINATYVVVRIWDRRRLIVPLTYFIENPFQNWTRESASILGNVIIYLDYRVPVAAIRAHLDSVLAKSSLWDREVAVVQVTDFQRDVIELRILASASNAGRAFDLRCEIRESLCDFLQSNHPYALPRFRNEIIPPSTVMVDERQDTVRPDASRGNAVR